MTRGSSFIIKQKQDAPKDLSAEFMNDVLKRLRVVGDATGVLP